MKNYRLYIGLNVQNGKDWERQDAVNIIINICKAKGITALSISDCQGIYTYDNGQTVYENTLVLTLIDCSVDIKGLVLSLKSALRQECIMLEELINKFEFM